MGAWGDGRTRMRRVSRNGRSSLFWPTLPVLPRGRASTGRRDCAGGGSLLLLVRRACCRSWGSGRQVQWRQLFGGVRAAGSTGGGRVCRCGTRRGAIDGTRLAARSGSRRECAPRHGCDRPLWYRVCCDRRRGRRGRDPHLSDGSRAGDPHQRTRLSQAPKRRADAVAQASTARDLQPRSMNTTRSAGPVGVAEQLLVLLLTDVESSTQHWLREPQRMPAAWMFWMSWSSARCRHLVGRS